MMQSAQARRRNYGRFRGRPLFGRPAIGRVFAQAIVNSVFVMVVHVIADQSAEMWFVQRDHVVENLSPATSHPSFRNCILPWRLYARPFGLQSRCPQEGDHFVIEQSRSKMAYR